MLRGIGVYGLIPSGCSLFAVMEEIRENQDQDEINILFSRYYKEYSVYKIQSLIASFVITSVYSLLFFLNKVNNRVSLILTLMLTYLMAMIILMLTYTINYLVFQKYTFKMSLVHSFIFIFKNIYISISVLIAFIILFLLGRMNLVFLIFFTPVLYVLWVRMLINKFIGFEEEKQ